MMEMQLFYFVRLFQILLTPVSLAAFATASATAFATRLSKGFGIM